MSQSIIWEILGSTFYLDIDQIYHY